MRPHPPAASLTLLTLNVNGLSSPHKAKGVWDHLLAYRPDVTFLQETHIPSTPALEACLRAAQGPCLPWRHTLAASPAISSSSCGVAVLARQHLRLPGCVLYPAVHDAHGRLVCWDWDVGHLRLRLVCVYAPTVPTERPAFHSSLQQHLETDRVLLVGGDWNCVTNDMPGHAESAHRRAHEAALRALLAEHDLVDPWPAHAGGAPGYTHPATPKPASPARLDRWYVGREAVPWVKRVVLTAGPPGDHFGVLLSLSLPEMPTHRSEMWRFPTYLLFHPTLRAELKAELQQHLADHPTSPEADPRLQWETDKAFLRVAATAIHRRHRRQQQAEEQAAVLQATALTALAQLPQATLAQRSAAEEAHAHVREVRKVAAAASHQARSALMEEFGEKGTAWFHGLAENADAASREPISHLRLPGHPDPVPLTGPNVRATISAAAAATYSSASPTGLFRVQPVCAEAQQELLSAVGNTVPDDLRSAAEGPDDGTLTAPELAAALGGMANGKAPGPDGLPYEVYKVLWELLGPRLCAAAAASYLDAAGATDSTAMAAALPPSWLEGLITLIYKGNNLDKATLTSYRPITLLNTDLKIISKAISNRLQPALDAVIDPLQTAFISGRWIGDNVLYHQALIEWLQLEGTQDGAMLLLDIEKAYDRVHRQWLYASAAALGLGPGMQRWIRLLTSDSTSRVVVNGMLSDPFPVRNGLPQGSTLSPALWIIQLQPLTSYLHHKVASGALHTPLLPGGQPAPPVAHHADDTNLVLRDPAVDGPVVMAALDTFSRASNARINTGKSKAVGLGRLAGREGTCPHTGMEFLPRIPRHLGIPMAGNHGEAVEGLYKAREKGMRLAGKAWQALNLSLVGRVHIAKQVLAAKLAYHFSFLSPTPELLAGLIALLDAFVARSPLPEDATLVSGHTPHLRPRREVACLPRRSGGLGHIDLPAFLVALQAKALALLAHPGRQPWKELTKALLAREDPAGSHSWAWPFRQEPPPQGLVQRLPRLAAVVQHAQHAGFKMEAPAENTPSQGEPPGPQSQGEGWRCSEDGKWVVGPQGRVLAVHYTGRLLTPGPSAHPPAADDSWLPACIIHQRKPRWRWTLAEREAYNAASPSERPQAWPREPALLNPTDKVVVHPDYCHIAGVRLSDYTVKDVRTAVTAAGAPNAPVRPVAWEVEEAAAGGQQGEGPAAGGQAQGEAAAAGEQAGPPAKRSRLSELEAQWKQEAQGLVPTRAQHFNANPVALEPWLYRTSSASTQQAAPMRQGGASTSTATEGAASRRSARLQEQATAAAQAAQVAATGGAGPSAAQEGGAGGAGPAAAQEDSGGAQVEAAGVGGRDITTAWQRLWDCPASRNAKALVYRLQHGCLPCGLYRARFIVGRRRRREGEEGAASGSQEGRRAGLTPRCPHPACGQQRPQAWASLTHVFLECPAYTQARQWLQDLWGRVAPQATPPPVQSAALMLGDQPSAWADYPAGSLALLWTTLRATFLHVVWSAYYSREPEAQTSQHVVREVTMELRRLMRLRFTAATLTPEALAALPTQLLTAQLKPAKMESFMSVWTANGVLCTVEQPPGEVPRLTLHLQLAEAAQLAQQ